MCHGSALKHFISSLLGRPFNGIRSHKILEQATEGKCQLSGGDSAHNTSDETDMIGNVMRFKWPCVHGLKPNVPCGEVYTTYRHRFYEGTVMWKMTFSFLDL